ncbi:MSMEG_0568 family radical SAM protein [uncultured Amnibacterium sp.]|uniref:MSMEG_0568 family radical SAM protein n=1 Tax=uncultured Amnibacterium sp. TaxID=1631851 RepID=UPI0035CB0773
MPATNLGLPAMRCESAAPPATGMDAVSRRVDVALRGLRVAAPVHREAGAGPSDDGHVLWNGEQAAVPVKADSPYLVSGGRLLLDTGDAGPIDLGIDVAPVHRPRFYDLTTGDGTSYEQIARLHGRTVLATTVVQTCIRYDEDQRCRFCAIEASLEAGATIAVKTPAMLAEVARAAVDLDGVEQMVMTTGTSNGWDRGAKHLARCVAAVKEAVPELAIQVQIEPPRHLRAIRDLYDAGAESIGIHVESMDDAVRQRWMPGKSTVSLDEYRAAWAEAVRVFGRNQVSTYLLVGLGEDPDDVPRWAEELIALGVYPFVVPFRPLRGTLATDVDGVPAPSRTILETVSRQVAALLVAAGMLGSEQKAGCAACGACGVLKTAGA